MNTNNFAIFLAAWFATGDLEKCSSELLSLAEDAELDLPGKTLKARQIALGCWLTMQTDQPVKHEGREYTITRGKFLNGRKHYRIQSTTIH